MNRKITRALISVSDKEGIVEFARFLDAAQVDILSTGGTARLLQESGISVTEVSELTGFPEMMDGRVKTLHPLVHGGLLGRRGQDDQVMAENGIIPIDLLVVNLYPFRETVRRDGCTMADAIENIDIGGPAMIRAAAKNHNDVAVVVSPSDYAGIMDGMATMDNALDLDTRLDLAIRAFEHTAAYDGDIANYLGCRLPGQDVAAFPRTLNLQMQLKQPMRYGENPHQEGVFYTDNENAKSGVSTAAQLQGKALSYNNVADTDAAFECVSQFDDGPACVIVKHANPCGAAQSESQLEAYDRAYSTDSESAFGGILAFNTALESLTCEAILERQFVEVIIAPAVSDDAKTLLAAKPNVRVLETGSMPVREVKQGHLFDPGAMDFKRVRGGLLVQEFDDALLAGMETVSGRSADQQELSDLLFAWKVAKFVKSNAIVYARKGMTIGVGAGQMSRVNSARIAAIKAEHAGLDVAGAVMASDAFFPFRDGIDSAAKNGIRAIIQPGGSMRDDEVIAAADEHDIAMVFTGMRHFRH